MGKRDDEIAKQLNHLAEQNPIDWTAFDKLLSELEDINAIEELAEETLLSECLHTRALYWDGSAMPDIARHFLSHGYDVKAHEGKNGGMVLYQLCWTSYDRYVLDTAKVLLNVGAPLDYELEDDDPEDENTGAMAAIHWKLSGSWGPDKNFVFGNIMEAYDAVAKAAQAGKDFNSIDCFLACIGKQLTAVSAFAAENEAPISDNGETASFSGPLVFWFQDRPLVIRKYIDFVVDPVAVADMRGTLRPVDSCFEKIIGSTLTNLQYVDGSTAFLDFDNGVRILFTSYYVDGPDYMGRFAFFSAETVDIKTLTIDSIWRRDAHMGSMEEEDSMVLVSANRPYLIYPVRRSDEPSRIEVIPCSKPFLREVNQQLRLQKPSAVRAFRSNGNITALRFVCGEEYLYFKLSLYEKMEVILSTQCMNPRNYDSLRMMPRKKIDCHWHHL